MSKIELAKGYWDLASERTDKLRLHNIIVGDNKASPTDSTYRGRAGTVAYDTRGSGPAQKMWMQEGTLDGQIVTVSGGNLFVGATDLGSVGNGSAVIAGSPDRAVVVVDNKAWRTDGTSKALIVMPDDVPGYEGSPAPVSSVRFINGFFLLSITGTDRFYWIQPGEDDPDALDFVSAERLPDYIVTLALSGDEIWVLGGEGEEVFAVTTDTNAPFQSIIGRVYDSGCADKDSLCEVGGVLTWVTKNRLVAVAQGSPQPISDDCIAEILSGQPYFKAWSFNLSGHAFYVLTTPQITLVFDFHPKAARWYRWSSYGYDTWRPITGCQDSGTVYCGDSESGQLWTLDFNANNDAGEPIIREISGSVDVVGPPVSCNSVTIRTVIGYTDGTPLELRWSDNQGKTFSSWRQIPLGSVGQYDKDAIARSCGLMQRPGRTFVWRFSGNSPFRVDWARLNDA